MMRAHVSLIQGAEADSGKGIPVGATGSHERDGSVSVSHLQTRCEK